MIEKCLFFRNGNGAKKNNRKPQLCQTPREPVHWQLLYELPFMPQQTFAPLSSFYDGKVIFRVSVFKWLSFYHASTLMLLANGESNHLWKGEDPKYFPHFAFRRKELLYDNKRANIT